MTAAALRGARDVEADTVRAAVYCRISDDRQGLGLGVERQAQDCLALVQRNGWVVTRTLIENDTSAYCGKPRPRYAELMDAVAAGEVDVIVAWDPDRLHRLPAELVLHRRGGAGRRRCRHGPGGIVGPKHRQRPARRADAGQHRPP